MKRSFCAVLLMLLMVTAGYAAQVPTTSSGTQIYPVDESKAPAGFRDLKFGQDITNVPGMKKTGTGVDDPDLITFYERESDKLFIGEVPLNSIQYVAMNGKLMDVYIDFKAKPGVMIDYDENRKRFERIRETLFTVLGEIPSQHGNDTDHIWFFKDIQVNVSEGKYYGAGGSLSYKSTPLRVEMQAIKDKRAADEKATHERSLERAKDAASDL